MDFDSFGFENQAIQSLANIKNGIGGVEILVSLGKLLREGNGVFREGDFVRKPPEDGVLYRTKPTERGLSVLNIDTVMRSVGQRRLRRLAWKPEHRKRHRPVGAKHSTLFEPIGAKPGV